MMTELFINLDFSSCQSKKQPVQQGNRKHQQFLKRRRLLKKRVFLNQKQIQNGKPGQERKSWDHNKQNGQADSKKGGHDRTGKLNNNTFHQQRAPGTSSRTVSVGAPGTSSRTVSVGAPRQPSTISISINCAPNHPRHSSASEGHKSSATDGAKKPSKPKYNPLSKNDRVLPPVVTGPSYKMVAIDCEMVGTGLKGRNSALARCSIVTYQGDVVYDKYVKPGSPVTDYRTRWSGIRREHLINAIPFTVARKEVLKLLHGKIVIGHAIQNDYKVLSYFHPKEMTRDTSKIPLLNRKAGFPEKETVSLKRLCKQLLNKDIQMGRSGHSSVEDARSTMELYQVVEAEYERELAAGIVQQ
ncbi:interferon-stimulated 20 kDa exonuclease-like 2 isoform X2 [Rhinoderma darwinii]|uniref:interferon-stimulated 20 kDa exonuclease-like 2 isoform X2 n=1 Tax=Rhinoderma darwinii TaxID=43563 RepID=UPI003F679469